MQTSEPTEDRGKSDGNIDEMGEQDLENKDANCKGRPDTDHVESGSVSVDSPVPQSEAGSDRVNPSPELSSVGSHSGTPTSKYISFTI